MRLLAIDSGQMIAFSVLEGLSREGIIIDRTSNIQKGVWMAKTNHYDFILLQIDSIFEFEETLKTLSHECFSTYLIAITKSSSFETKINFLEKGADEVLTQPYYFRELVLKIRILSRREKRMTQSDGICKIDDLTLDPSNFFVQRSGREIKLRRKEFDLLYFFFRNQGKVITKMAILEGVWDCNADISTNTLEVHVLNLRKKLDGDYPSNRHLIHTVYGRGYRFGFFPSFSATAVVPSS